MELEKKVLSDEEIENFPLFFKVVYHNLLVDSNLEEKLMMYNPRIKFREMRAVNSRRRLPSFYDWKKEKSRNG